jgi:hypothetical protein
MLLRYFLNDFEMVTVAPIIVGITFVFTVHMRCISIVRSSHFTITILYYLLLLLLLRSRHIHKHECNVNWIEWDDWVNTSSISFCCTDEFLFWCPVRCFFKYYCCTCTSAGFTIGLCAVKLPSTYTDRNAVAASMLKLRPRHESVRRGVSIPLHAILTPTLNEDKWSRKRFHRLTPW